MNYLKPITHRGLSGSVREAIERAIVQGELEPGTQLVDRHLASLLNVSRTPVREALRHLEPTGLVRRHVRGGVSGWVVTEFREQDVRELFELRRVLEPLGLKWLASHWDDAVANGLATWFDDLPEPVEREEYEAYVERDRAFHHEIVSLSHNSRVIGFYGIMETQIDRIRHFLSIGYEGRMSRIVQEHGALCAAIRAQDMEGAADRLVHHLHKGEESMIVFARERHLLTDDEEQQQDDD